MWWREFDEDVVERNLTVCDHLAPSLSLILPSPPPHAPTGSPHTRHPGPYDEAGSNEDLTNLGPHSDPAFIGIRHRDSAAQDILALCKIFQLSLHVYSRAVNILDRFLSVIKVRPKFLNCICLSCVHLALRFGDEPTTSSQSHDLNRFIIANQSKCTVSDVTRMSEVIERKTGLDYSQKACLATVFSQLDKVFHFPSFAVLLDFYASCLCVHQLAIQPPRVMLNAILQACVPAQIVTAISRRVALPNDPHCNLMVSDLLNAYNSGKLIKFSAGSGKYSFRLSQRTVQTLLASRNHQARLSLSTIDEESVNTSSSNVDLKSPRGAAGMVGPQNSASTVVTKRGHKRGLRYTKAHGWFGFSNQATARAAKPYYRHLVSSFRPSWAQVPVGAEDESPVSPLANPPPGQLFSYEI